jgi:sterol desaturase/sphingolipid hydroxylase (fatty acid hydroxylase superfamily)
MHLTDFFQANYAFYFTFWDRWNNTLYQGKRRVTEAKDKQFAKSANSSKKEV